MPRVFQVHNQPSGLPATLTVRGVNSPPGNRDYPVHVRNQVAGLRVRGLGRLSGDGNNAPGPNGAPGSGLYPYNEQGLWGDGSQTDPVTGALVSLTPPPAVGSPPAPLNPHALAVTSTPYGESARDWSNPTTYATIPVLTGTNGVILNLNLKRNSLIIQNLSTATMTGDVAPTLYVGFNVPAVAGQSLGLPPGLGFYWGASDCPPRDTIYLVFGPFTNTGGSVVIQGCVVQGTYAPNIPPLIGGTSGST
jgi:hypothetical protein